MSYSSTPTKMKQLFESHRGTTGRQRWSLSEDEKRVILRILEIFAFSRMLTLKSFFELRVPRSLFLCALFVSLLPSGACLYALWREGMTPLRIGDDDGLMSSRPFRLIFFAFTIVTVWHFFSPFLCLTFSSLWFDGVGVSLWLIPVCTGPSPCPHLFVRRRFGLYWYFRGPVTLSCGAGTGPLWPVCI